MKTLFMRFPTILQACECIIEMLRGQYAHSVGCYNEAAFHYIEAAKVYMWYVYNLEVSYIIQPNVASAIWVILISPYAGFTC